VVGSLGALETAVTGYNLERVYIVDMSSAPVALALHYSHREAAVGLACCRQEVHYTRHMGLELACWKMVVEELHMMLMVSGMVAVETRPLLDQLVLIERHYRGQQSHN